MKPLISLRDTRNLRHNSIEALGLNKPFALNRDLEPIKALNPIKRGARLTSIITAALLLWVAGPYFVSAPGGNLALGSWAQAQASSWATALHRGSEPVQEDWLNGEDGLTERKQDATRKMAAEGASDSEDTPRSRRSFRQTQRDTEFGPDGSSLTKGPRLELIAPDNNDTVITLAEVKREGVTSSLRRLMVNTRIQCTGAQAEPLTLAQRQMELRAYGTILSAQDPEHRKLTPMQTEAIAEMPLCDEYLLDLVMISRLLEGYQIP